VKRQDSLEEFSSRLSVTLQPRRNLLIKNKREKVTQKDCTLSAKYIFIILHNSLSFMTLSA
jgi:hypothetical protein